ncbi:MAG: AAA family ATPase, partial [Promethearchaeota archaeon]
LVDQFSFLLIEITEVVKSQGLFLGYDFQRDALIIDEELLVLELEKILKTQERVCLCGPPVAINPSLLDLVIVLHLSPDELRKRLEQRAYKRKKVEENIESELMGIILLDSQEIYGEHLVHEILGNDEGIKQVIELISSMFIRREK